MHLGNTGAVMCRLQMYTVTQSVRNAKSNENTR